MNFSSYVASRRGFGIIGGKEITPHSEPWLAMPFIGKNRWARCGATLISHTFAFTAAHCDGAGYRETETYVLFPEKLLSYIIAKL